MTPPAAPRLSRRGVLAAAPAGAVAAVASPALAGTAEAAVPTYPRLRPPPPVPAPRRAPARPAGAPVRAAVPAVTTGVPTVDVGGIPLASDPVLHLLRRATYGPTAALLAQVRSAGVSAWLDQQLAPQTIDDSACTQAVAALFPDLSLSAAQLITTKGGDWTPMYELQQAAVLRAVLSKRQLFELMVEFWNDHLHIETPSDKVVETRTTDDRDVIRAQALGRFADLLWASATSPAMLYYLDNASSTGDNPNENYGRELLELHTVGIGAGYSETDMHASALALTGLTVDDATGAFVYDPSVRYVGPLTVMGWSSANSDPSQGLAVARSYVTYLARHPATAQRLAQKLARRFVSDSPPQSLVDALAATYLAGDTAIAPVLKQLFLSAEFAASVGQKVRRPMEDFCGAMRAMGAAVAQAATAQWDGLVWGLSTCGHAPMDWPAPDGYPDVASYWMSTSGTLARWNLHEAAAGHWWSGSMVPDVHSLLGGATTFTGASYVDTIAQALLLQPMAAAHRSAVLGFLQLADTDPVPSWTIQDVTQAVAALILDSPYWVLR